MVKMKDKKSGSVIEIISNKGVWTGGSINVIITTSEGTIVDLSIWPDGSTLMHHAKDVTISQYEIAHHEIQHGQHTTVFK